MARPRRKWTKEEDEQLQQAVKTESRPLLWRELAKSVPGRTNKDCRKRWWNTTAEGMVKGTWTEEEDERLIEAFQMFGAKWKKVSGYVASRTPDQCSSHWSQVLDPTINYCDWTADEDSDLLHAVLTHGTNWAIISRMHQPQRPSLALKNRYSTLRLKHTNVKKAKETAEDRASKPDPPSAVTLADPCTMNDKPSGVQDEYSTSSTVPYGEVTQHEADDDVGDDDDDDDDDEYDDDDKDEMDMSEETYNEDMEQDSIAFSEAAVDQTHPIQESASRAQTSIMPSSAQNDSTRNPDEPKSMWHTFTQELPSTSISSMHYHVAPGSTDTFDLDGADNMQFKMHSFGLGHPITHSVWDTAAEEFMNGDQNDIAAASKNMERNSYLGMADSVGEFCTIPELPISPRTGTVSRMAAGQGLPFNTHKSSFSTASTASHPVQILPVQVPSGGHDGTGNSSPNTTLAEKTRTSTTPTGHTYEVSINMACTREQLDTVLLTLAGVGSKATIRIDQ